MFASLENSMAHAINENQWLERKKKSKQRQNYPPIGPNKKLLCARH